MSLAEATEVTHTKGKQKDGENGGQCGEDGGLEAQCHINSFCACWTLRNGVKINTWLGVGQ